METGVYVTVWVLGMLFVFGILYNRLVARWEQQEHGYTAGMVIGGVLVTLLGMGLIDLAMDWNVIILGLMCFAASGTPMTIGAAQRYMRRRELETQRARELARELLNDDETPR